MSTDETSNLLPIPVSHDLEKSISSFNTPLASFLGEVGLPTENILSPIDERKKIIAGLAQALAVLPLTDRSRAYYLTKFIVAVTVGLFDGALNYLWNETTSALRRLVARFDLAYFFAVAEKVNSRNKNFREVDDLTAIDDHDLLETCRRIGLISDVNHRRLTHVNYMRNHASAAHPNENEIDGYEMLGWLTSCLRYAITAEPEHSVITVKRLLENIRTESIPSEDFVIIGEDVELLTQERIDDLLWTLFGMFVDPRQTTTTKTNITGIASYVWNASTEDRRYEIGAKFGGYRKNGDVSRKDASQEFLRIAGGQTYKDEDSLATELTEKLDALRSVHFAFNNFYNEYPHAKGLESSLPITGIVPRAARTSWIRIICICYIGNGMGYREGVDENALPYYKKHIASFTESEVIQFLHLMSDVEFTSAFASTKPDKRVRMLARDLKQKSGNIHIQKALDLIIGAPQGKLDTVSATSPYKEAIKFIPKTK